MRFIVIRISRCCGCIMVVHRYHHRCRRRRRWSGCDWLGRFGDHGCGDGRVRIVRVTDIVIRVVIVVIIYQWSIPIFLFFLL